LLIYLDDQLAELAARYEARYLILPQAAYDLACADPSLGKPGFECVYPAPGEKATWVVLEMKK